MPMHTLPEAFYMATTWGIWKPKNWRSNLIGKLYDLYTFFHVLVMTLLLLVQLIALMLLTENVNDFAAASYVFLATLNGCVKGVTLLWRKKRVSRMADILLETECIPKNIEEMQLCLHYDRMSRFCIELNLCSRVDFFTVISWLLLMKYFLKLEKRSLSSLKINCIR